MLSTYSLFKLNVRMENRKITNLLKCNILYTAVCKKDFGMKMSQKLVKI